MNFNQITHVYLLGIGGIGMSGLARYFNFLGKSVAGYDKTPSDLTLALEQEGIAIHYDDNLDLIPADFLSINKENQLLIYTPAIPKDHREMKWFKANGYSLLKRSEVLGMISENYQTVAVAGTHGKTTTSSIAAHLMYSSKVGCSAFLGGISVNYETNLLLAESKNMVVEADEFDRSFLTLSPQFAILTSTDADHLDIYGDASSVKNSYLDFTNKLKPGGKLIVRQGLDIISKLTVDYYTYEVVGVNDIPNADFSGVIKGIADGAFVFDLHTPFGLLADLSFSFPGRHNVENAVAACAASLLAGATENEIRAALASFLGVKRRFEYKIRKPNFVYIDDYAHHPSELAACIGAVKEIYPNKKITGVFQPHLFSRTRDFADGFAESLTMLDCVILLDIYPARELPISGITSEWLLAKISSSNKFFFTKEELVAKLLTQNPEVLLTLGAGDIDRLVKPLCEAFG